MNKDVKQNGNGSNKNLKIYEICDCVFVFQWQEPKTKNHYVVTFDALSGRLLHAECHMNDSSEIVVHMDKALDTSGEGLNGNPIFACVDFALETISDADKAKFGSPYLHMCKDIPEKSIVNIHAQVGEIASLFDPSYPNYTARKTKHKPEDKQAKAC